MSPAPDLITLLDEDLEVVLDPGRGADVLTLRHRRTGVDVLFSTPWREHADAIRAGDVVPTTHDPVAGFLEQYRGGWNTLCPNAGPPRVVHGAPVGFHGEAATARWAVVSQTSDEVRLTCTLFSVPVLIERRMALLPGGELLVEDQLTNLSDVNLEIDYVSHPAFGGRFLEGGCRIETNAQSYTTDPGTVGAAIESLYDVPAADAARMAFGWLSEFDGDPWTSITNSDLGLSVRITWDATHLPYAWLWQELSWTEAWPWHQRARAIAIEPSSTPTSGDECRSVLGLTARQTVRLPVSLTVSETPHDTKDGA